MSERFRIRTDRRVELLTLVVAVALSLRIGLLLWNRAPGWALPLSLLPLFVAIVFTIRGLRGRAGEIVLSDQGIALVAGGSVLTLKAWALAWSDVRSIAHLRDGGQERLVVQTDNHRREATLRSDLLGWRIERREALVESLHRRGYALPPPTEPTREPSHIFHWRGEYDRLSRGLFFGVCLAFGFLILLEVLTDRREKLIGHVPLMILFGGTMLQASRTHERLEISSATISLIKAAPKNLLVALLPRPFMKESVAWAVAWNEIRRVKLGTVKESDPTLWIELETAYTTHRLLYKGQERELLDRPALRALFTERGFPIELTLYENPLLPGPSDA